MWGNVFLKHNAFRWVQRKVLVDTSAETVIFFSYKSNNPYWNFTNENMKPQTVRTGDWECITLNQFNVTDKWNSRISPLPYFVQLIALHSNLNAELMLHLPGCRMMETDNAVLIHWSFFSILKTQQKGPIE